MWEDVGDAGERTRRWRIDVGGRKSVLLISEIVL